MRYAVILQRGMRTETYGTYDSQAAANLAAQCHRDTAYFTVTVIAVT